MELVAESATKIGQGIDENGRKARAQGALLGPPREGPCAHTEAVRGHIRCARVLPSARVCCMCVCVRVCSVCACVWVCVVCCGVCLYVCARVLVCVCTRAPRARVTCVRARGGVGVRACACVRACVARTHTCSWALCVCVQHAHIHTSAHRT
jgi:hypothetical protein